MPSLHGQSMVFLDVVVGCSVCLYGEKHLTPNLPTLVIAQSGLPSLRGHLAPFCRTRACRRCAQLLKLRRTRGL